MGQLTQLPTISHYTAYKPRPFTREQRDHTTILYGGLTWKHERLMQGALHNLKYNAEPLPNIAREDLDAGKELIDVGACCPTIFTTGSLVNFLKKEVAAHGKKEVADKYVFLTAGACGPCRFGQYHESYAMALDGLGLQTHEGEGNYNIKRWLEQEDSEVVPPPVAVWLHYLLHPTIRKLEHRNTKTKHPHAQELALHALERIYRGTYNRFRKALANLPNELPDQEELKRLAEPFYHFELRGGEGHMLIGKALHAYHHKKAYMICELSPYSCMPNTMSIGAMAIVIGKYPDLLYAPIEVQGDSEVHALSRCQMILTEAKKRAQAEFEDALNQTGLTIEAIRQYEAQHPQVRSATYRVPHLGCAGTAANYVLHLARNCGLGEA